jgi:acyl carrier protein
MNIIYTSQEDKKSEVIKSYIEMILRQILKFDEDEPIDENQNFSEMGMDSLMMLEMKNLMQTMLGKGVTMNVSAMQELTTVLKLVAHLEQLIANMGQEEERGAVDLETFSDELIALINQDMVLPEYLKKIKDGMAPAVKRSQIKSVLLTGKLIN